MGAYTTRMQFVEFELEDADPSWATKVVDEVGMEDTNGNPFPPLPPDPEPDPEES